MEPKKLDVGYEDGKVTLKVDMDQDGKPLLELKFDVLELPSEAIDAWKDAKEAKA